jgi:hypothetical protein
LKLEIDEESQDFQILKKIFREVDHKVRSNIRVSEEIKSETRSERYDSKKDILKITQLKNKGLGFGNLNSLIIC